MSDVADSLVSFYRQEHPDAAFEMNIGASSTLARQIEFGATADIFFSADTVWSSYVRDRVPGASVSRLAASNSMVAVSRSDDAGAAKLLENARRIGIGDPSHVPAGRYAKSALECMGLWQTVSPRLVPMPDVRAALAAARTKSVDAALVYQSDILSSHSQYNSFEIGSDCQPVIAMDMVVFDGADVSSHVRSFADFVVADDNLWIWEAFGFAIQEPGE